MPTPYRDLVDYLFTELRGYPFSDWVADERDRGRSWRQIAEDLSRLTDGQVEVSHAALHTWFKPAELEVAS